MTHSAEEIGAKMDALGIWELLEPYNFAIKPKGTVFPYFCTVLKGERKPVKARFLMLEGWQTLHDFVRTRYDNNFGFYSTPAEMPHLELVLLESGLPLLFRHDPGFMPQPASDAQRALEAVAEQVSHDGASGLVDIIRSADDDNALGLQQLMVYHSFRFLGFFGKDTDKNRNEQATCIFFASN